MNLKELFYCQCLIQKTQGREFILLPDTFYQLYLSLDCNITRGTTTQDRIDIRTISSAKLFHQNQLWSTTLNDQIVSTY